MEGYCKGNSRDSFTLFLKAGKLSSVFSFKQTLPGWTGQRKLDRVIEYSLRTWAVCSCW